MQLYQLDNRHQIFNNALQYFIDKISNPNFLQFVLEQTQKPYQFNQDWTEVTVPRLIEHIMNNDHSVDMIEIINFILKYSEFNFELILKNITTRLQLQEKTGLQKIHNMHPLIYLLTQILNIFEPRLDDVTEVVDEVLTALRHFIRDLLREYAVQTKVTPVGDFIVAFSTQLPSKIDSFYCATQLITIFVNEIANTISYLQFQKKLFSQQKIKLLDLVINLQNSTSLYKINFYFNFYDIQETKNGICQLCQFKDQKLISLHETEGNTLLLETCLECLSNETQISENFEEKIYLPSIIYGHACQKKDNWIKLLFENHYITQLSKKEKTQKQSKQIKPIKISEAQQFLSQLVADYTHLGDNIHKYLWYFAYMSFLFQTLFSTYRNIELILLAFFEDNSVQVRAKVLNQFQEYCLRIKNLDTPKKYVFPIFNTQFVIQRIRQRPQDVSKQIRGLAIKTILILLGNKVIELNSDYLEIIIKRLQDIELQVRIKTVQCCLDYVDIFRNLPQHDKIKFFEEVSKRLEERGEIADLASQLIMLLLVTDNKNRDVEIADRLLELTLDQNNLIIDYERIQNLINKLSDDNKIIDKTSLLHHILLRLFQFSTSLYKGDKSKLTSVENALRLIQIIINENNTAQQRVAQKQIDNIMEITSYFLSMEDDHKNLYANILNGLFKLLIFCIEEFQTSKTYENHMPFQVSTKLKNQFDYLIIFIEKIIFGIHPKTAYVRSIFTLSVLLDLKYNPDGHKNIYSKLETVIKLILIKSNEDSMSFQFALIGFCQIFEYFEYFIQKSGVDVRSFLVEDLQVLYDCLLEYSKDTANEEIIFTMSKMWEKIPQLMFESCDFLKENLKQNSFPEPIIIAIYQTFYKSIIDANLQADKQQFDQKVDKSRISFLIKDIFNVVFQKHILHENKKIRILVLKLIELLFDNQLSIALQFGDYLILTLINEAEIAEPIIKKCLEVNAPNMLMQFKSGIKMIIQNKSLKPYFTNLNILVKNLNKQTLICKSPFYDVCSSKLCEYIKDLDNAFFLNKIDSKNYFEEVQFLLYQFIHLQYLSKNEIKAIIKGILYRVDDFLGRIERRLQELYVDKDYSLAKAVSFKVFCAYQLAVEPDKIFGENILTLRQFHQMKDKIKRKKEKETVKEQQCYEIQHKHINKFLQYINSSEINLAKQNINFDLSDSDYEKKKTINSGKVQQYKLELDLMEKILDFELGKVDEMLKLFDEIGVFDKVEETVGRNEEQEDDINEEQKEPDATKKIKKKTTKRKPRK